ncbi:ArsR/SmtB family transcription factor [Streptomyces sp. NPDC057743]|uniref:ArsR/SmtB family transcription factor n=1 Tax=Streptomyces sp. NPDC057743 TaxID=3346236 RepID=UPI003699E759
MTDTAPAAATPPVSPDPDVSELMDAVRALANPMRLQMLVWLRDPVRHFAEWEEIADPIEVGVCVGHIQAKAGLAQSTVSAYLAELQRAGLVRATRVGKWTHYRRDEQRIAQFVALLGRTL